MDIDKYVTAYLTSFDRLKRDAHFHGLTLLPRAKDIIRLEEILMELFFPGRSKDDPCLDLGCVVKQSMKQFASLLHTLLVLAYSYEGEESPEAKADGVVESTLSKLSEFRALIKKDAQAGLDGDPAAKSLHEIILCYPAIKVLACHRVSHYLYTQGVPLLPRMINELLHSQTGIDIHPGATIGESFFIDHGTGVVIGETTIIGNNVKIYQGVTLGALSFPKDGCGRLLKGAKRHPTICDNVTIYANATVLGDIVIGENTTIGSSAWIKESIAPNSRVMIPNPEIIIKEVLKR